MSNSTLDSPLIDDLVEMFQKEGVPISLRSMS